MKQVNKFSEKTGRHILQIVIPRHSMRHYSTWYTRLHRGLTFKWSFKALVQIESNVHTCSAVINHKSKGTYYPKWQSPLWTSFQETPPNRGKDFSAKWHALWARNKIKKYVVLAFGPSHWPRHLRPWLLGRWDRGFESRLRHGYLYSSFCVVLPCVGRSLRRTNLPSNECYQFRND
jgi:hypothetical protein